jgi:hypothetical protein
MQNEARTQVSTCSRVGEMTIFVGKPSVKLPFEYRGTCCHVTIIYTVHRRVKTGGGWQQLTAMSDSELASLLCSHVSICYGDVAYCKVGVWEMWGTSATVSFSRRTLLQ